MNILLTGGLGYIGSHTAVELIAHGHDVIIVDNLCNSKPEVLTRLEKIVGKTITFYEFDLREEALLDDVFQKESIDAVLHFAGLKAVGESVEKPLEYYDNNVGSSVTLLRAMERHGVGKLVFSSSATVYGSAESPYSESSPTGVGITNPYGQTKYVIETMMQDVASSNQQLEFVSLRYFNPVGAHESGLIGEDPSDTPNNLFPYIAQVAVGKLDKVKVFGDDYATPDGTGVRDYIHVVDLARGHVAALEHLASGFQAYNLGSGHGTSVLELIAAFSEAAGHEIPYTITARRPGDLASYYAHTDKAAQQLGWSTEKTIQDACRDSWKWQSSNPNGYIN